ncbi:hypothetical protein Sjap_012360 [Stephania japonica]|uniref:Solute carrier family 35 member F1 n=1 Tax=Stephania japonica TaxID=461633 RepID=A0AAP0IVX5_9MAGN
MNLMRSVSREGVMGVVYALFLGQVVSLNLSVTSFTASLIANLGVHIPLTQSFFTYLSLALVYTPILLSRRRGLLVPWYWYLFLAFVDVQANFLVIKAYQYSSITSVTLLDCCTTPWAMILTWFIIGTRYSVCQFIGAALCIVGLGLVVLSDLKPGGFGNSFPPKVAVSPQESALDRIADAKNPVLGDILVVAGTLGYAISNVGQEYCVKKRDRVEFISMLGVFGILVSICQISIFERNDLRSVNWSTEIVLLFVAFALSTFIFYTIVPFVLRNNGAAMFNLSLLTSDLWAVLIRLFFYHQQVNWLYYISYVVVAIGLVIYSVNENKPSPSQDIEDGSVCNQYQVLNQENPDSREEAATTSKATQT